MTDIARKCAEACRIVVEDWKDSLRIREWNGLDEMWTPETNPAQAWIVEEELIRRVDAVHFYNDCILVFDRGGDWHKYPFTTPAARLKELG